MTFKPTHFVKGREREFAAMGKAFEELVSGHLDPILTPFGFKITPQNGFGISRDRRLVSLSAVYETSPQEFARRFPQLDHDSGHLPCIDLWIHQDPVTGTITAEIEGNPVGQLLSEIGEDRAKDELEAAGDHAPAQLTVLARALDIALSFFHQG